MIGGWQTNRESAIKGMLFMVMFGVLWALIEFLGQAMPGGISAYQVVWSRYLLHLLLTLGLLFLVEGRPAIQSKHLGIQLARSGMMLIMPVAFICAAALAPQSSVLSVLWVAPLLVMILDRVFRKTRVAISAWLATTLCLGGTLILLQPDLKMVNTSTAWSLAAALSLALYLVLTTRIRDDSVWVSLFYTGLVPFAVLSFVMPAVWTAVTPRAALLLIAIGGIGWIALLMLDKSIRHLEPAHGAIFMFVQLLATHVIFRASVNIYAILGIGLIVVGLGMAAARGARAAGVDPSSR